MEIIIDFETAGIEVGKDYIWQASYILLEDFQVKKIRQSVYLLESDIRKDKELIEDINKSDTLVAHNVNFERKLIERHLSITGKGEYCTMLKTQEALNLKKFPKLSEVVESLELNKDRRIERISNCVMNYHDSLFDVCQTLKLYTFLKGADYQLSPKVVVKKPSKMEMLLALSMVSKISDFWRGVGKEIYKWSRFHYK